MDTIKTLPYISRWGTEHHLAFYLSKYRVNGATALEAICFDEGYLEPFSNISVNLPDYPIDEDCIFLDENNLPGIGDWMVEQGLGQYMNSFAYSGFCSYPLFKLNMDKVKEYCLDPKYVE